MASAALSALFLAAAAAAAQPPPATVHVVVRTTLGDVHVRLETERAPLTTANFLRYVAAGHYRSGRFHRTVRPDTEIRKDVPIEVVQAGPNPARAKQTFPPISLERTSKTGLEHLNGTISMARDGPDTATADFFICIGDQPSLDYGGKRNPDGQGFAAFGRVVSGMEVVRRIQASRAEGQRLTPPIEIVEIERLSPGQSK
jgi:peptidyl-prolyl cis-trans isomerase A (cyclophilin A)